MKQKGFSLIELMITIGIISVISAIALPLYTGYIQDSRQGALVSNMATIELFEEDFRMRTGAYSVGNYDLGGGDTSITTNIGWSPQTTDGTVYLITLVGTTGYKVNATDSAGETVCMDYPQKARC